MNETQEAYLLGGIGALRGLYAEVGTKERAVLAIGTAVLAHDVLCREGETISEWFDEALERHKVITLAIGAAVVGHVFNLIPPKYDGIHRLAQWVKQ